MGYSTFLQIPNYFNKDIHSIQGCVAKWSGGPTGRVADLGGLYPDLDLKFEEKTCSGSRFDLIDIRRIKTDRSG